MMKRITKILVVCIVVVLCTAIAWRQLLLWGAGPAARNSKDGLQNYLRHVGAATYILPTNTTQVLSATINDRGLHWQTNGVITGLQVLFEPVDYGDFEVYIVARSDQSQVIDFHHHLDHFCNWHRYIFEPIKPAVLNGQTGYLYRNIANGTAREEPEFIEISETNVSNEPPQGSSQ
jgi:hypothetical protein